MTSAKILIVDDEAAIREMLRMNLELSGFDCVEAADAIEAHGLIVDELPQLVLLDWMLPGTSGIELVRRLKKDEATKDVPVIMLTAKADEGNKIQGLEGGVDDYITKPFSPRELIARVNAVLRRSAGVAQSDKISVGELVMEPDSHRVTLANSSINLGPTEYRLLNFFMTHQERVYSRAQLLDRVWGGNVYVEERTVDVHIRRLRKALLLDDGRDFGQYIQTVRGAGYRFSEQGVVVESVQ
ncbi:Phosphate regulon transcriptional regulatory protein PhoB [Sinobacterium norvegicum]|uniref:Phosphate regulon transcriptional regulatory protein PhoB n=1 Tax=Sinobacterium norvegicum TaxID=1641715 RepID=A0ABM9AC44_9GAMM|nr:phosphate regulon transcriptional regulator PhoB [Sinobacterium norvegicum]CAH0990547.1 Phosphate regulon transcriptional regulatory protein PhoB [Sinobacterium norvegicum]